MTEIEILRCHACNMPLVLGDGSTIKCRVAARRRPFPRPIASVVVQARAGCLDLGEAAEIDRAERHRTLDMLARELGRYAFRTVVLGIGFAPRAGSASSARS